MNTEQAEAIKVKAAHDVNTVPVYRLSKFAECGDPDNGSSAGANLLVSVRDSVAELIEYLDTDEIERIAADPQDIQWLDDNGRVAEIADGAPDVYTYTMWAEFLDLAAYNEDPSEVTSDCDDMTKMAGVCLYIIAGRLAWALLGSAAEFIEDAAGEIEEDD